MDAILKNGNAVKVLKTVLFSVIDREFLSSFTYTGKTHTKKKKLALRELKNIVNLLYSVTSKLIGNYAYSTFENHLVNKVIKHAYTYSAEYGFKFS